MGRVPKKDAEQLPMDLRKAIAANLVYYMGKAREPLNQEKALAARAGVSYKTIQRLRLPESSPHAGTSLGSLYKLSVALGIDLSILLVRRSTPAYLTGIESPPQEAESTARTQVLLNHKKGRAE